MAVDYDLVIIGGSLAGRYAAAAAAKLKATVALVEPIPKSLDASKDSPLLKRPSPLASILLPHCLSHIGQLTEQLALSQFGIDLNDAHSANNYPSVEFAQAIHYALNVVSNLEDQSPVGVGVDFIQGNGQFVSKPSLAFVVHGRRLVGRSYIIATNSRPAIPEIEGLQMTGYVTPSEVWQLLASQTPPQRWVILGSDPTGCQIAQTLARFGLDVTLVVRRSHILVKEDPEISHLVQAILEAEGVRVLTSTTVTQVKRIDSKKWIQAEDQAIEFDEILLCAGQQPDFAELNLKAVGVKLQKQRLLLNQNLQTTNHRIYACGDAIGGYHANIANYEASIALKNALFFPKFKVDYRRIPWVIFSDPQLARVGLTEVQARRIYNRDILVLREYFKIAAAAQIKDEITGMCKLVVRRNGMILGAAIVGDQAGELINIIALAIAGGLKVDAIATLAPVYPSFSEIIQQTAAQFRQVKLYSNPNLQNFLEGFFNLRRSF